MAPIKVRTTSKLGTLLQEARQQSNLSQKEVADALGYNTAQVVSDWERGLRSPPAIVIQKLVKLYDVPLEQFFDILLKERTAILEKSLRKKLGMK